MPLTDLAIKATKPQDKPYRLFDGEGLYLEIAPNGGRYWRLKYRFAGKEKRLAIGVYPRVSLQKAREERHRAREKLAQGLDPSSVRQQEKAARLAAAENTFELVARRWWSDHAPTWSPAYAARILRRMEADVFPVIGGLQADGLTAPDLRRLAERMKARGVSETVRRALQEVGQVLIHADLPDITVSLRKKLPSHKVAHMPAVTDPAGLAVLLKAIDAYTGSLVVRNALRLLALVFVRPGELRAAKWADIDLQAAEWRYHITKTNTDHIVPLSREALAVLRDTHKISGRGTFVFPSPRGDRPLSENALGAALLALGYSERHTAHGFRATARTLLDEELRFPVDIIEAQLGHTVRDPLGRAYNRTAHLPARRKMMARWGRYLQDLTG